MENRSQITHVFLKTLCKLHADDRKVQLAGKHHPRTNQNTEMESLSNETILFNEIVGSVVGNHT